MKSFFDLHFRFLAHSHLHIGIRTKWTAIPSRFVFNFTMHNHLLKVFCTCRRYVGYGSKPFNLNKMHRLMWTRWHNQHNRFGVFGFPHVYLVTPCWTHEHFEFQLKRANRCNRVDLFQSSWPVFFCTFSSRRFQSMRCISILIEFVRSI